MIANRIGKINFDYIFVFLISFIPQIFAILISPFLLMWDEYAYLDNVKHVLYNTPYFEYYRFPLLWWILIPVVMIVNFNIFAIKLFLVLIYSISVIFLFKIINNYGSGWKNYVLILSYSLNGIILFWGSKIYPDILATSFLTISIYFFYKYFNEKKEKDLILYSLFSDLSILSKYEYGLWLISSIVFLNNKEKLKAITYSFLFALPYFIYNILLYGNPIYIFIEQTTIIYEYTKYQPIKIFVISLLTFAGAYLFSFIQNPKKLNNFEKAIYLYSLISILFLGFFVKTKDFRYIMMTLPSLIILTRIFIEKLKGLLLSYMLIFFVSTITSFISGFLYLLSFTFDIGYSKLSYVYRATEDIIQYNPKIILTNTIWPLVAYYTNSDVYILYNATYQIPRVYPDFIIYSPNCGIPAEFDANRYNLSLIFIYTDPSGCKVYTYKVNSYDVK
ncbi:MAG: ArnT family glycosyltransferase [Nanopusillaceae archaeon]